jgi:hypothetical protein
MPFDNFPLVWRDKEGDDYDHTYSPKCTWDGAKTVTMEFPASNVLREFYGFSKGICSFIVLTTTGASGGVEGF